MIHKQNGGPPLFITSHKKPFEYFLLNYSFLRRKCEKPVYDFLIEENGP